MAERRKLQILGIISVNNKCIYFGVPLECKKWLNNFHLYTDDHETDLLTNNDLIEPIINLSNSRNIALERFSKIK